MARKLSILYEYICIQFPNSQGLHVKLFPYVLSIILFLFFVSYNVDFFVLSFLLPHMWRLNIFCSTPPWSPVAQLYRRVVFAPFSRLLRQSRITSRGCLILQNLRPTRGISNIIYLVIKQTIYMNYCTSLLALK